MIDKSSLWQAMPIRNPWPRITAPFGGDNKTLWPWWDGMHNGLDFSADIGEPVFAVRSGRIFEVRSDPDGYGNYLKLGTSSNHVLYAHLSRYAVKDGDRVKAGQVIGYVGATGHVTGAHLHLGMRVPSVPRHGNKMDGWVNPLPFAWRLWTQAQNNTLSDHWNAYHRQKYDDDALRRWQPPVIKLMRQSYLGEAMNIAIDVAVNHGAIIILRNWSISERHDELAADPEKLGKWHADWWANELNEIEKKINGKLPRHLIAVEGINEPHEWSYGTEKIARYVKAFAEQAVRHNLIIVTPCFGVGWPGNDGIDGKPPHWHELEPMRIPLTQFGGLLATHEYLAAFKDGNGLHTDYGWGWWIGRYRSSYDASPSWQHLFRVITETGVDNGVIGRPKQGWHNAGLSEDEYMAILKNLDEFYRADPFVLGANIFTRDGAEENDGHQTWFGFDIRGSAMMERIIGYAEERRNAYTPPEPPPDGGDGDAGGGDGGVGDTPPPADAELEKRVSKLERWARAFE